LYASKPAVCFLLLRTGRAARQFSQSEIVRAVPVHPVAPPMRPMFRVPFLLDTGVRLRFALPDFEPASARMNVEQLTKAKSFGFSDRQIAHLTGTTENALRAERKYPTPQHAAHVSQTAFDIYWH
jgi:hypothetical protein